MRGWGMWEESVPGFRGRAAGNLGSDAWQYSNKVVGLPVKECRMQRAVSATRRQGMHWTSRVYHMRRVH